MTALAPDRTVEDARVRWPAWRASRLAGVTAPTGNLALVETRWLAPDEERPAATTSTAQAGPDGRTLTSVQRRNIVTGEPEYGYRRWDANSPAIQHFETIDVFDFAPNWVIEATLHVEAEPKPVAFEHLRDNGGRRELAVPGDITFTLDGVDYALNAFDDDGTLLLVFGDRTNGVDTYAAGRFLFVEHRPGTDRVILDFNQAFVPPCGFSDEYNCPMPPPQNRFDRRIEAGEKLPIFRDGFSKH
jgi:uncharacterized protein (DUF1684 family)